MAKSTERRRNWDVALVLWARDLVGCPFEWGVTDCGTLWCGTIDALYGPCTAEARGLGWSDVAGATRKWRELGDVRSVAEGLGAVPVHRSYATGGDLVHFPGSDPDGLPRLGIIVGNQVVTVDRVEVTAATIGQLPDDVEVWRLP